MNTIMNIHSLFNLCYKIVVMIMILLAGLNQKKMVSAKSAKLRKLGKLHALMLNFNELCESINKSYKRKPRQMWMKKWLLEREDKRCKFINVA